MIEGLEIWQDGSLGRLKLNRPKALNALTFEMTLGIRDALTVWRDDKSISAVVIEGAGDRAFCAGGDLLNLYNICRDTPQIGVDFWREEYRLNAMIARYPKPYIALMDGITMGGGVGVSAHASHRIVTERSVVAMPEVSIGFLPDVGGTYLLSRAPGLNGLYLGMTGANMNAEDAIFAGFADHYCNSEDLPDLLTLLQNDLPIDAAIQKLSRPAQGGQLAEIQHDIGKAFGQDTALACAKELADMNMLGNVWAGKALNRLRYNAPLSVAAAFHAIHLAAKLPDLEACLALEFRFAARTLYSNDFYEGVRAIVVDKDKQPYWQPANLEHVTQDMVDAALAPLGDQEWTLN